MDYDTWKTTPPPEDSVPETRQVCAWCNAEANEPHNNTCPMGLKERGRAPQNPKRNE